MGTLSVAESARLDALATRLATIQPNQRYITYREAEQACELLAEKILQFFSREELAQFQFAAIPRGGMIVLGMLSYTLNLRPEQISADWRRSERLILVDDCAFSGAQFFRTLAKTSAVEIAFVHLYSHPKLRDAILYTESRVTKCISAHDLPDCIPEEVLDTDHIDAWQELWLQHLGSDRYWAGFPEPVAFPWSEPDHLFWNPVTERIDDGWRFLPPQQCLKNKYAWELPPRAVQTPSIQVSSTAVVSELDTTMWLCETESGELFSIAGVAADMWKALAVYGDLDVAADYLLSEYTVDAETILEDLSAFAHELLAKGLLQRC